MLAVTDLAKQELKKMLFAKVDHPLAGIRLVRDGQPDNFGLTIDIEIPGDEVVKYDGSKILIVDRELSEDLNGNILDVEYAAQGNNFVVIEKSK
jgi:hypothetical protein